RSAVGLPSLRLLQQRDRPGSREGRTRTCDLRPFAGAQTPELLPDGRCRGMDGTGRVRLVCALITACAASTCAALSASAISARVSIASTPIWLAAGQA